MVEQYLAEQAVEIVAAYPKRRRVSEAQKIVLKELQAGASAPTMLEGTIRAAEYIREKVPNGHQNDYVPGADTFFAEKRWMDDPELIVRQKQPTPAAPPKHAGKQEKLQIPVIKLPHQK